jgi:hypothetical protein
VLAGQGASDPGDRERRHRQQRAATAASCRHIVGTHLGQPRHLTGSVREQYGGGSIPFVDIGNRYLLPQVQYLPSALAGMSWTQVAAAMRDPSSAVAKDIDGAANVIAAAICTLTHGQPAGVCQSVGVRAAADSIQGSG